MKQYGVIIADPPWQYGNDTVKGGAGNHYAMMAPAELERLPVAQLAAPDAVLLLWATWPQLDVAMSLVTAWSFQYVTGFPWIKLTGEPQRSLDGETIYEPSWGTGYWVRACSEMVLIGRRGNVRHPDGHFLGLLSPQFRHSRKPDNLYQYAEQWPGPYLEMFARRPWPGWDAWGNEVDGIPMPEVAA